MCRIPRCPDDLHLTTELFTPHHSLSSTQSQSQSHGQLSPTEVRVTVEGQAAAAVTLEECFVVFISHRWTRAGSHTVGYAGHPEADSAQHDKHALCVAGIQHLWDTYASELKHCLLWIDYACINQNICPGK